MNKFWPLRGFENTPEEFKPKLRLAGWVLAGVLALMLVVIGVSSGHGPTQYGSPGGTPFGTALRTLPTSRHVTGLPYPKTCTLGSKATPDKSCTPGAADDEVHAPRIGDPGNLKGTICTPGWTDAARALDTELVPVKAAAVAAYNIRGQAVLTWLVPLSLGGSNDASNLFPIPITTNTDDVNAKANVDATVTKAVCAGTVGLAAAQTAMTINWTTALNQLGIGG